MMHPYSYTADAEPPHAADLHALSDYVNAHEFAGAPVRTGPAASTLQPSYTASGTTLDYMSEVQHIKYAFTWEVYAFPRGADMHCGQDSQGAGASGAAGRRSHMALFQAAHPPAQQLDTSAVVLRSDLAAPRAGAGRPASRALLPGGARPLPASAPLMPAEMTACECFAYFNPTSKQQLDALVAKWASALLRVAEFFGDKGPKAPKAPPPTGSGQQAAIDGASKQAASPALAANATANEMAPAHLLAHPDPSPGPVSVSR